MNSAMKGLDYKEPTGESLHVADVLRPRSLYLLLSCLISAVLHLSIVATLTVFVPYEAQADIEVSWLEQFDNLEELGHGRSGRWAELRSEEDTTIESKKSPVAEPKAPKVAPPPTAKVEKVEKVEKAAKPKRNKPDIKKRRQRAETQKKDEIERATDSEIPALDRNGPNQLPSMESYGPGNMIMSALLRIDRLRSASFEQEARKLLEFIPDFRIALAHTGLDPVNDLDSIFMASARPEIIQHSFVAVRHSLAEEALQKILDRRHPHPPPWQVNEGLKMRRLVPTESPYKDSRKIVLDNKGLGLIVRPEWLPMLVEPIANTTETQEQLPTLLEGLRRIEEVAESDDTMLLISAQSFRLSLPVVGPVALESLRLAFRNPKAPALTIDLGFPTERQAEQFSRSCPRLKHRLLRKTPLLFRGVVSQIINPLTCERDESFVAISGVYSAETIRNLLGLAGPLLPNPPILAELPGPPSPSVADNAQEKEIPSALLHKSEPKSTPSARVRINESPE